MRTATLNALSDKIFAMAEQVLESTMMWTARPRSELLKGVAAWQTGSGEPLVLLHGVGLNADAWGAQAHALGEAYALCALDLPGHGASVALASSPRLADYSECIAAAIASLGAPVLLAGHSMGAMIAIDLAIRYPRLCRGVAALNTVFRRNPGAAASVRKRADALPGDRAADPTATLERWFGPSPTGAATKACRRWLLGVDPLAYKQAYTVFANEDGPSTGGLESLHCPALFLTGGDEPNSTPAMSRAMADMTPRGHAIIVDGAAHMMPMTHPAEVNVALLEFFAGCPEECT